MKVSSDFYILSPDPTPVLQFQLLPFFFFAACPGRHGLKQKKTLCQCVGSASFCPGF